MSLHPVTDSPIPPTAPRRENGRLAPSEAPPLDSAEDQENHPSPTGPLTVRQRWNRFPSTGSLWLCLLAFTAIAAFFRFWRMGFQSYWTDESYTVYRIHGTFSQMLASLNDQGFPPGWYALLRWWTLMIEYFTGSGFTALSPESTRALTAIFGTLVIPAMYFLARQFTDRKGALLAALLTAFNPYLIYYSRDIKMYEIAWLFVILNLAVFLKWQDGGYKTESRPSGSDTQRTARNTAAPLRSRFCSEATSRHLVWFPLYVLTGFLMVVMHSTAWFMVALQLIFLLTRLRIRSLDGPLWVFAVGIMALLPAYWYLNGTNFVDKAAERDGDLALSYENRYTDMSWTTIGSLPCIHLLGFLLPSYPPDSITRGWFDLGRAYDAHAATRSWPWMARGELDAAIAVGAIMIFGLIPWRGLAKSQRWLAMLRQRHWWTALWIAIPIACLAATWIPQSSPWHQRIWHGLNLGHIWEPRYLGMLVPAWILWLAASLRRLPTWPLRTIAILFVLAVSCFSALSNHLILRNPPFQDAADIAMKYFDPVKPATLAVAQLDLLEPGRDIPLSYQLAARMRPFSNRDYNERDKPGDWFSPYENLRVQELSRNRPPRETEGQEAADFLRNASSRKQVQHIALTDREGDIADPKDPLSNQTLGKVLGPQWKLVEQKTYELHYEWRFYIFNTWRTRVWQRMAPTTIPTNAAVRSKPATMPGNAPVAPAPPSSSQPATVPARN